MPIEEAGEGIADRLVLELVLQIQSGDGHSDDLHELRDAVGAMLHGPNDCIVFALDEENAQRIAVRRDGLTEIAGRSALDEVGAVDLRKAGQAPARLTGTQATAGLRGTEILNGYIAPGPHNFDNLARVIDHAEAACGAGQKTGQRGCGDLVDLLEINSELDLVARGCQKRRLMRTILERLDILCEAFVGDLCLFVASLALDGVAHEEAEEHKQSDERQSEKAISVRT